MAGNLLREIAPDLGNKMTALGKIEYAIQTLQNSGQEHSFMHHLAVVESIRKIFSVNDTPEVSEVIQNTQMVRIICDILARGNDTLLEERCLKLEALWILNNLAYTDEMNTMRILYSDLESINNRAEPVTYEALLHDMKNGQSPLL